MRLPASASLIYVIIICLVLLMGAEQPSSTVSVPKIYSLRNGRSGNFSHTYRGHSLYQIFADTPGQQKPLASLSTCTRRHWPNVPRWSFSLPLHFLLAAITRWTDIGSSYSDSPNAVINYRKMNRRPTCVTYTLLNLGEAVVKLCKQTNVPYFSIFRIQTRLQTINTCIHYFS